MTSVLTLEREAHRTRKSSTIDVVLRQTENRMRAAHATHLGYPYNLVGKSPIPASFDDYLVNNLGDPYIGSHYASQACDLEREAVAWLMDLWSATSARSSGARSAQAAPRATSGRSTSRARPFPRPQAALQPRGALLDPEGRPHPAHRGDPGRFRTPMAPSTSRLFAESARSTSTEAPLVVALTCGTTVKGAHDDIAASSPASTRQGIGPDRRFVHVDGALNAMVLPFVDEAPPGDPAELPSRHRQHIDLRPQDDRDADAVRRADRPPPPCRSRRFCGRLSPLQRHDPDGLAQRARRARRLVPPARPRGRRLPRRRPREPRPHRPPGCGVARGRCPVLRNPYALTVVFPQPPEPVVRTYQLACERGRSPRHRHAPSHPYLPFTVVGFDNSHLPATTRGRVVRPSSKQIVPKCVMRRRAHPPPALRGVVSTLVV